MQSLSLSFASLLSLVSLAFADQFYTLVIGTNNVNVDGTTRRAVFVNGEFEAPLLTAQKNDRIFAEVINEISDSQIRQSTSIHWHGMFQHRSAPQDGVAFVTQCPIAPQSSFLYNFSTAGQTGTYWYHSHLSTQYCDGLRGPLVVYDPEDPHAGLYQVDNANTVISLEDWYDTPAEALFPANSTATNPTPNSILVNKKGHSATDSSTPLSVIEVVHGTRYRFRLVNLSCLTYMTVSIDGHTFSVIEADGVEIVEQQNIDSLIIFPGQRYSIVVNANQPIGNYWFRSVPGTPVVNSANNTDPGLYNAIFRYLGAPLRNPTTNATTSVNPLVESSMVPLVNPGAPGGSGPPTIPQIQLTIGRSGDQWTINGASFVPPSVPVLLQILSGNTSATDLLPSGDVYNIPAGATIEVSIPDTHPITGAHPFHLHGHNFDIIQGPGQTTPNYVNPPRRDVVGVYGGGVIFRFTTNNSGPWILHCHIDWHFSQGLAVVFAENAGGIASGPDSIFVPPAWRELCNRYDALPPSEQ